MIYLSIYIICMQCEYIYLLVVVSEARLNELILRLMTGDHDVLGLGSVLSSCRRLKQIYINYSTEEKKQLRSAMNS